MFQRDTKSSCVLCSSGPTVIEINLLIWGYLWGKPNFVRLPIANELSYKIALYYHLSLPLRSILNYVWNVISAGPFLAALFTPVAAGGRPGCVHTEMILLNVTPLGMQPECCLSSQDFNDALQTLGLQQHLHLNEGLWLLHRETPPITFSRCPGSIFYTYCLRCELKSILCSDTGYCVFSHRFVWRKWMFVVWQKCYNLVKE